MKKNILGVMTLVLVASFPFSANAQTFWADSGANIYNTNTGKIGIGTMAPNYKLDVRSPVITNSNNFGIASVVDSNLTLTGAYYTTAIGTDIGNYVLNYGVTNSGYAIGFNASAYINSPGFRGTLNQNTGLVGKAGIYTAGAGGRITEVSGGYFQILNNDVDGIMDNAYGVYIDNSQTVGTIYNRYGVYQNGVSARNYFAGSVGIGKTNPAYKLDVNGAINATSVLVNGVPVGGVSSQWTTGSNSIYYNGGNVGVGTATPASKLDVNGSANINGNLSLSGSITSSGDICIGTCQ